MAVFDYKEVRQACNRTLASLCAAFASRIESLLAALKLFLDPDRTQATDCSLNRLRYDLALWPHTVGPSQ